MKAQLALFLTFATLLHAHLPNGEAWNTLESRRAFLIGMSSGSDLRVGDGGLEGFWPGEIKAAELYGVVAKLYAQDIGVEPKKIASGEWKELVARALKDDLRDISLVEREDFGAAAAFLSGAYARWGKPTGFRLSGFWKAYEIAERASRLNEFTLRLVHEPGIPGGTTITITKSEESYDSAAEFFDLMHQIEAGVTKEPNSVTRPTSTTGHGG